MSKNPKYQRPSFDEALRAWKTLLKERDLPDECVWIFAENLCFEPDPANPGAVRVNFQTTFTPQVADAEGIAYDYFCESESRLVFYRAGSCQGVSVCLLLCDEWFEDRGEAEGFVRRDDWLISFRPGGKEELEQITAPLRWKQRLIHGRPLHDLDFCLPLRAIHETVAHGRVLSTYERFAHRLFHLWWRMMDRPERE